MIGNNYKFISRLHVTRNNTTETDIAGLGQWCLCVHARMRACVRACVRAYVRACLCVFACVLIIKYYTQ